LIPGLNLLLNEESASYNIKGVKSNFYLILISDVDSLLSLEAPLPVRVYKAKGGRVTND
jgi:hypothetical protein